MRARSPYAGRHGPGAWLALALVLLAGCVSGSDFLAPLFHAPARVPHRLTHPAVPGARLSVIWVGHATVLLQLGDRFVLTDPVFTSSVGQLSARLVEPGLRPEDLPPLDAVLISHLHFDHLSLGSLELIKDKVGELLMPEGGLVYLTNFPFRARELRRWHTWEQNGLRITAVPVQHNGFRYGADAAWMTTSFTGYVIQYRGVSVYFPGDTAYDRRDFVETCRRFPHLDLALLPIAPIEPRGFMRRSHLDPAQALQAYLDLGARWMIPIHYATFVNGLDKPGQPLRELGRGMRARGMTGRQVGILRIGERRVLLGRKGARPSGR